MTFRENVCAKLVHIMWTNSAHTHTHIFLEPQVSTVFNNSRYHDVQGKCVCKIGPHNVDQFCTHTSSLNLKYLQFLRTKTILIYLLIHLCFM